MWGRIYSHAILLMYAIICKASCQEKGSLTFVVDTTRSMIDEISILKQNYDAITEMFSNDDAGIQNMVLVTFNDPKARVETVTKNRTYFIKKIENIHTHSQRNWDCAELPMNAVLLALENSLPRSLIYVFTDASSKDFNKIKEVINVCQEKQSQVFFVLTGFCHSPREKAFQVYYDIAAACSGSAYFVTSNHLDQVLTTMKDTIRSDKKAIARTRVPSLVYTDVPFVIGNGTEYAMITASGFNVSLKVHGPKAGREPLMWLKNVKVLKLRDPAPGQYTATVMGNSKTSVNIVGRTY